MRLQAFIIAGSVRKPSHTISLSEYISGQLQKQGMSSFLWRLDENPLPIADPAFHRCPEEHNNPVARKFVETAANCDAFVFASPIYHNSYSGVLKNALDILSIPLIRYKAVGLVSHGGNRSTQAVDHLRIVVRGLYGIAIPTQVCTSNGDYVEYEGGYHLETTDLHERVERFSIELITMAATLRTLRLKE